MNHLNAGHYEKCLFITGPMGSGKSTFLKKLQLNVDDRKNPEKSDLQVSYVDLDDEILSKKSSEKDLCQLIESVGLEKFRTWEREVLIELIKGDGTSSRKNRILVVALGGGTLNALTWESIFNAHPMRQKHWRIIWIDTPFAECYQRCQEDEKKKGNTRPLMKLSKDELSALYYERLSWYRRAHLRLIPSQLVHLSNIRDLLDLALY